jgi:hypothetical protein
MNLRVAKKISKNATNLDYGKTQVTKAETVLRRSKKNAEKASK